MRICLTSTLIALLLALAGCADQPSSDNGASTEPTAGAPTETTDSDDAEPSTPPEPDAVSMAAGSANAFGFDMFQGLADLDPDENVVTSPYSAAVLLTMLMNGADGETREAIGEVLHLDDPFDDSINDYHKTLAEYLVTADSDVELSIANSLWAQDGYAFEEAYMSTMEEVFDASIEEIDLGSEEAADQIDGWVADKTRDRIEEMAEDLGLPDSNSVLVLLNAVYFLGDWTDPFDPDLTEDGPFTLPDGSEVEVPLMSKDEMHLYSQQDGFQALRLTYGETERFAMDVFLPDEGSDANTLRDRLDSDLWEQTISELNEGRVSVTLPSFEIEYNTESDLNKVLKDLGMGLAFDPASDFTAMSPSDPWLDDVVQKTFILVDEEGTEAAAVTGADMEESMPPQFRVDRPFLFTISEAETGTILFLGQITNPAE